MKTSDSIIIDLVEMVEEPSPKQAIESHFAELASENKATAAEITEHSHPDIFRPLLETLQASNPIQAKDSVALAVTGTQNMPSGEILQLSLTLIRLPAVNLEVRDGIQAPAHLCVDLIGVESATITKFNPRL